MFMKLFLTEFEPLYKDKWAELEYFQAGFQR